MSDNDTTTVQVTTLAVHDADEVVSKAAEQYARLAMKIAQAAFAPDATSLDAILDMLSQMDVEAQLTLSNVVALQSLHAALQELMVGRMQESADAFERTGQTEFFGSEQAAQAGKFQLIATKIAELANLKVEQVNASQKTLTKSTETIQPAGPSRSAPSIDNGLGAGDDGRMNTRIDKLESDVAAIKIDVAVIKANGATKSDIAELRATTKSDITELRVATKLDIAELSAATKLDIAELRAATKADFTEFKGSTKADIAEAKTQIIMWVVGAVFMAQLLPALLKMFV